jgi:hypothetical protein
LADPSAASCARRRFPTAALLQHEEGVAMTPDTDLDEVVRSDGPGPRDFWIGVIGLGGIALIAIVIEIIS